MVVLEGGAVSYERGTPVLSSFPQGDLYQRASLIAQLLDSLLARIFYLKSTG